MTYNEEMTGTSWTVDIIGQAKKFTKDPPKRARASYAVLLLELRSLGPYRTSWPNYTKTKGKLEDYHCHIEKGNPTYVVCWRITDKKNKVIEVYYAGTHEKAPY